MRVRFASPPGKGIGLRTSVAGVAVLALACGAVTSEAPVFVVAVGVEQPPRQPLERPYRGDVDGLVGAEPTPSQWLAQLRGYRGPLEIGYRVVALSEWPALLFAEIEQLSPENVSREVDEALATLGLLPVGYESRAAVLHQLLGELRGVYLSSSKVIALAAGQTEASRNLTLLHELAHAYQDRDHGLGKRLRYRPEASDEIAAMHAFSEGEALTLELLASSKTGDALPSVEEVREGLAVRSASLPLAPLLQRSIIAPYVDGYRFVMHLRQRGGWPLVERTWERGLFSTRELLHAEEWVPSCLVGECVKPRSQGLPPLLPAPLGANSVSGLRYRDSLGEQGLRLVLEEGLAYRDASELAALLEGDRLSSYAVDHGRLVLWQLRVAEGGSTTPLCQALETVLSLDTRVSPQSRCILRASTQGTVGCGRRDILVLFRSHADTWTQSAQLSECWTMRRWTAEQLADVDGK